VALLSSLRHFGATGAGTTVDVVVRAMAGNVAKALEVGVCGRCEVGRAADERRRRPAMAFSTLPDAVRVAIGPCRGSN